MRKLKKGRKFSRERGQRKALIKSLVSAFILKEKIRTTEAKAKDLRIFLEKYINRAKNKDLTTKRFLAKFFSPLLVKKLTEEIGPRYKERRGGYTRILKLGQRKSDGTKMAIIELVK